jgi:hypothetical protein
MAAANTSNSCALSNGDALRKRRRNSNEGSGGVGGGGSEAAEMGKDQMAVS